jgi:hypothetical protein
VCIEICSVTLLCFIYWIKKAYNLCNSGEFDYRWVDFKKSKPLISIRLKLKNVWLAIRWPTTTYPLNHFLIQIVQFESIYGFLPTSIHKYIITMYNINFWPISNKDKLDGYYRIYDILICLTNDLVYNSNKDKMLSLTLPNFLVYT